MIDNRDLRDPSDLGEKLLSHAGPIRNKVRKKLKLTEVMDDHVINYRIENYASPEHAVERYGDPSKLTPVYAEIRIK